MVESSGMGEEVLDLEGGASAPRDSSTNTDSDRVLMTKRAIFRALCELMDERDFSKIGVGDVLERAGVSRSTFFRCFNDKYDIINWSFKRFKNIRVKDRDRYVSFDSSLRVLLDHLEQNRRYYVQALHYTGQNSLRDYMYETNEEYMVQCWHAAHGPAELDYGQMSTVRFAAAGFSKIIEQWVLNGCMEPVDDVATAIVSLVPHDLHETLY